MGRQDHSYEKSLAIRVSSDTTIIKTLMSWFYDMTRRVSQV
jgi:hypothetical protein